MISGTDFTIKDADFVIAACRGLRPGVADASEIEEIRAQCASEQALCLSCEDGFFVVELRPQGDVLELFVWIAVAFKHGFYERQDAALDLIGRDLGADQVAFQSRRRGWGRHLAPAWRRRGSDEFVRQLR